MSLKEARNSHVLWLCAHLHPLSRAFACRRYLLNMSYDTLMPLGGQLPVRLLPAEPRGNVPEQTLRIPSISGAPDLETSGRGNAIADDPPEPLSPLHRFPER